MNEKEHLKLPVMYENIERKKQHNRGGGFDFPPNRNKTFFSKNAIQKADKIEGDFQKLKQKFSTDIDVSLIYEIEINQSVFPKGFEKTFDSMGIQVLSIAEGKKGFWIVFNEEGNLTAFKTKLQTYGSEEGAKYDFFNAIESFQQISIAEKIGKTLKEDPLGDNAEYIDLELWKITDPKKNETFIQELKIKYTNINKFQITDKLITKSFVLLRVKINKQIFDEIIELNEIARADRPSIPKFDPFEFYNPDVSELTINKPDENATGILIIDSGIVSNHPMLEKCVGDEQNFQSGEKELQDIAGHGTAVAGCAAYGNIEESFKNKEFTPENWIFSAKIMYAKRDFNNNPIGAAYDPQKLVENQFKDAVESFLSHPEYHIKVINISLGNDEQIWNKDYHRQLPFAALIDELALEFPSVVFVVSTGNQNPCSLYPKLEDLEANYPSYLYKNGNFKIINPATSALAVSVGSIAKSPRIAISRFGDDKIKHIIADKNQPSPFTRTGMGINKMLKPELVEYGGNLILSKESGRLVEDKGGKILVLHNKVTNLTRYDSGTSFSAPKVANLIGKLANKYPQKSANFIKNMLFVGADYPFMPAKEFYKTTTREKANAHHLAICGYGLGNFEKSINSYDNRAVLWDESSLGLNQTKVYSIKVPKEFFEQKGKRKISVVLTFNPETRSSRGDSYLGNRMEFHLFHSINPQILLEKYAEITDETGISQIGVPEALTDFEVTMFPGSNTRKAGCHQKAWKNFDMAKNIPSSPLSLVLINANKWIHDENRKQDYCISVVFEHQTYTQLYNVLREQNKIQIKTRTKIKD
ncbi:MAG: hypothetical protein BKP49_10465 [Treponema sp. CETP13]|nr:MAG: hypothetical protein BKP49_10465 [Treponema sp. CETP13]